MSGFSNPIIGGGGALVYPSMHSPNFVAGSAGWTVNKDGSAEFNNVTIRGGTVISGTNLQYSGPPAAGNLIASDSAAAGTDSFGNAYLAGVATYFLGGAGGTAVAIQGSLILFFTGPLSGAGPWVQRSSVSGGAGSGGGLAISTSELTLAAAMMEIIGSLLVDQDIAVTSAGGGLLTVTETGGAPGSQPTQLLSAGAGDRSLGLKVSGDPDMRLAIDSAGKLSWGPGSSAGDTNLYRASAGSLQTDGNLTAGGTLTVDNLAAVANGLAVGQGLGIQTVAAGGTINSALSGVRITVRPVTATAARTGVILQPGTADGQVLFVPSNAASGFTITFAATATSNVATGVATVIQPGQCAVFIWVASLSLWFIVQ